MVARGKVAAQRTEEFLEEGGRVIEGGRHESRFEAIPLESFPQLADGLVGPDPPVHPEKYRQPALAAQGDPLE